jgi:adenylate kinase
MQTGALLTDQEVTELLDRALQNLDDQDRTILDGYPRSLAQAEWLLSKDKAGRFKVDYVLHLLASREAVKARMHDRGRADDHDDAIEARFREYEQTTLPILAYFEARGVRIIEVDGEQPIETVHKQIVAADTESLEHSQSIAADAGA